MLASKHSITRINCTYVVVITVYGRKPASSSGGITCSRVASIRGSTIQENMLTPSCGVPNRTSLNTTKISCARVVIIAGRLQDLLSATRLPVPLTNATPIIVPAVRSDGSCDLHIRKYSMTLAIEEVENVVLALRQTGHIIEVQGHAQRKVERAEVYHQLAVDEHPYIIVPSELEHLTAIVSKTSVDFVTVSEVVVIAVVVPTTTIEREKRVIQIPICVSRAQSEHNRMIEDEVLFCGVEPVVESLGGLDVLPRASTVVGIYGSAVHPNLPTVSPIVPSIALRSHEAFFVVLVIAQRQLEIGTKKPLSAIGRSGRS